MPKETYNVGYSKNDFFYNNDDVKIKETLNFNIPELIQWCNPKRAPGTPEIPTTETNIFDDRIISIVKNNKQSFINDYLPGNLTISNKYNNVGVKIDGNFLAQDSEGDLSKDNTKAKLALTTGPGLDNIALIGGYETSTDGKLKLKIDEIQTAMPDYVIDTGITGGANQTGESGSAGKNEGGKIVLVASDINPRCKFQPSCTINHEHYAKCKTQIFSDKEGKTYCKCVCSGPISTDAKPHQHCSPYNVKSPDDPGYDEKIDGGYNSHMGFSGQGNNLAYSNFKGSIDNMELELNGMFPKITGDAVVMPGNYGNPDKNTAADKTIRETVYEYYMAVAENKKLQNTLLSNSSFDSTAVQSMKDAHMAYKVKYLELFNIVSGIIMASGYIYLFAKKLPMFNKKIA